MLHKNNLQKIFRLIIKFSRYKIAKKTTRNDTLIINVGDYNKIFDNKRKLIEFRVELSLNLNKNECPDESFFSIAFANRKTTGTLRKSIESIVFPIRNAYYILRRGRSNRYRTIDRYRNEDIVQIILTINRQDINYATALALTIILLSLKTYARNSLSHTFRREKKTNTGWENWKTNRRVFFFIEIQPGSRIRRRFKSRSLSWSGLCLGVIEITLM